MNAAASPVPRKRPAALSPVKIRAISRVEPVADDDMSDGILHDVDLLAGAAAEPGSAAAAAAASKQSAGYAAFDKSIRHVLQRQPAGTTLDDTWMRLSQYIDKFFIPHDSCDLAAHAGGAIAAHAAHAVGTVQPVSTACCLLDDAFRLFGRKYASLQEPLQWVRRQLFTVIFVSADDAIANWEAGAHGVLASTAMRSVKTSPQRELASARFDQRPQASRSVSYAAKTFRQVLRRGAATMSKDAAVEYAETIKNAMLGISSRVQRYAVRRLQGMCFRIWRRHCQNVRNAKNGRVGFEPSKTQFEVMRGQLMDRVAALEGEVTASGADHRDMLYRLREAEDRADDVAAQLAVIERPPPPEDRLRVAIRDATAARLTLMEARESVQECLATAVFPPTAFFAPPVHKAATVTAADVALAWLRQYAKGDVVIGDAASMVNAYAYALHVRCPGSVSHNRLQAITLPDSVSIRVKQLLRCFEGQFSIVVTAALMEADDADDHVPLVCQLMIATQHKTRAPPPTAGDIAISLRHQLEYIALLEHLLLATVSS
jgi:hypothetical protein